MNKNYMTITIDDTEYIIEEIHDGETLITQSGEEFIVFPSNDIAGEKARLYWKEMAEHDSEEFTCMVGKENLVKWCLGKNAGPGTEKVSSLEDWFDLYLGCPEEYFATYDSIERNISKCSTSCVARLGYRPKVAYRTN